MTCNCADPLCPWAPERMARRVRDRLAALRPGDLAFVRVDVDGRRATMADVQAERERLDAFLAGRLL